MIPKIPFSSNSDPKHQNSGQALCFRVETALLKPLEQLQHMHLLYGEHSL